MNLLFCPDRTSSRPIQTFCVITDIVRPACAVEDLLSNLQVNVAVSVKKPSEIAHTLAAHRCCVVLCDISATGFDLIPHLRSMSAVPLVIIALVPTHDVASLRTALKYGADDVLSVHAAKDELYSSLQTQTAKYAQMTAFAREQVCRVARNIARALPHEFRTPLNSLLGFSQILQEHQHLSEEHIAEALDFITLSAQRLHRTSEKFLLFAELENLAVARNITVGAWCIEGQMFSVEQVQMVLQELPFDEAATHHRRNDLRVSVDGDKYGIIVIREQYFYFIVSELITNACKFSPAGSPIQLRATVRQERCILEIIDEGRGMTAEQIASVGTFRQFNRDHYEQQGVGLGLSIVKKITEIFGGHCIIRPNTAGRGLHVTTVFPVVPSTPLISYYEGKHDEKFAARFEQKIELRYEPRNELKYA